MKRWILPVRKIDESIYEAIKNGSKTIETRVFADKYSKIEEGDTLVFRCAGNKLEKIVVKRRIFPSIDAMYREIDFKKVLPDQTSLEEVKKIHHSFPNYEERLKGGIIAWDIK